MLVKLIRLIHFIIVLSVALSAFIPDKKFKRNILFFLIYLQLQYLTGYKKCGLTDLEDKLTNKKKEQGFIYSIINPYITLDEQEYYAYQKYLHYGLILILILQIYYLK